MAIARFHAPLVVVSASIVTYYYLTTSKQRCHSNAENENECISADNIDEKKSQKEHLEYKQSVDDNDDKWTFCKGLNVYYSPTRRNKRIVSDAVGLRIKPWGFSNPHFASLLAQLRPSPFTFQWNTPTRKIKKIKSPSGCYIEVDFIDPLLQVSKETPMVILLHGIGGHSREVYIEQAALQIVKRGWKVAILNYSEICVLDDCYVGGSSLTETKNISFLVSHLRMSHGGFLAAVGFSMGGTKLVQYLLRTREHCNLDAACIVSAPLDFSSNNHTVWKPYGKIVSRFYHFLISTNLKLWILKNYNTLRRHQLVKSSGPFKRSRSGLLFWLTHNSVPDIDRVITMPLKGRKDCDLKTYYDEASTLHQLGDGMCIPFLCITALNDPFIPESCTPGRSLAEMNSNIFIVNTQLGGHIGYWMPEVGCWATNAAVSFLDSVRVNAAEVHKPKRVRLARSIDAAHSLQRSSTTGLNNYFDFVDSESCSDLLKRHALL